MTGRKRTLFLLLQAVLLQLAGAQVRAPEVSPNDVVPRIMRFSGKTDAADRTVGITFNLYRTSEDSTPLWSETQNVKVDKNGNYTALLGSTSAEGIPVSAFAAGDAHWLGLRVDGHPEQPRILLVSVPYALNAAEAQSLAGHPFNDFVTNANLRNMVRDEMKSVSNFSPLSTAKDSSPKSNTATAASQGATNFTANTSNQVVLVTQQGAGSGLSSVSAGGYALQGTSPVVAIYGSSTHTTGNSYGVEGKAISTSGAGVYGVATATSGLAVGAEGATSSGSGVGVLGYNLASSGKAVAVSGQTSSTAGIAMLAYAPSSTGFTTGVQSQVNSTNGTAAVFINQAGGKLISARTGTANAQHEQFSVDGLGNINALGNASFGGALSTTAINATAGTAANALHATGGFGGDGGTPGAGGQFTGGNGLDAPGGVGIVVAGGSASIGQLGYGSPGGTAIVASAGGSDIGQDGDGIDASADNSMGAYAGNFSGDLNVTGAITAGTKDFKIDHPLDPANKYLYHASVESSEMVNIYSGNATTDMTGNARVQLPTWFESVNSDFRYQLTVLGEFAQAIVSEEIHDARFSIRTDKPNVKVSWQVTGVRHDPYAAAHPLQVEVEKAGRERGYYIHPELYGASSHQQIEWARHPEQMKMLDQVRAQAQQKKPE